MPFPQRARHPGAIHPDHRSQQQLDDDVRQAYQRWKDRYLVFAGSAAGGPRYRVALGRPGTDRHARTVSEGQGYGLVLLPLLAGHDPEARGIFDGLWRYARDHPSTVDRRLMSWTAPAPSDSAFDGDCDLAYGLLLADRQWGSGGDLDYRAAAATLLQSIGESTIGPDSQLPLLGDWVNHDADPRYSQYTPRTSDVMPANFAAFDRFTRGGWTRMLAAGHRLVERLQADHAKDTGLLPDFVQPTSSTDQRPRPADPDFLEGPYDGCYFYNAGRVPWRLAAGALLCGDRAPAAQAGRISRWAERVTGGDPQKLRAGYRLDGRPLPESSDDYYEDTVCLLCLLLLTGNAWHPTG